MSAPPPPPPLAGPNADLAFIVDAHVASFDYFVLRGMQAALSAIAPVEVTLAQTQFSERATRSRSASRYSKPHATSGGPTEREKSPGMPSRASRQTADSPVPRTEAISWRRSCTS
ncbi:hypothetical protein RI054_23g98200 [Pseudoscourfieldia marina]